MRSLSKLALFLVFTMIFGASFSQGIGIGQWRDHLPYGKTIAVAVVDEKVYCATPYSLFYYNKNDNSVERLNKINGLSDFGISDMAYNQSKNTLLIAYSNANIDLIKDVVVDYYNLKEEDMISKKRTQKIAFPRQIAMYLSRELTDLSLPHIGEEFGGRDHTTVIHAYNKIEEKIEEDTEFAKVVDKIKNRIKSS